MNLFILLAWLLDHATFQTLFHQPKSLRLQQLKLTWKQSCKLGLNQKARLRVHKEWQLLVLPFKAKLLQPQSRKPLITALQK